MKNIAKSTFVVSICVLTACSEADEPAEAADPTLFFASTDAAASRSGLDYADGTQTLADLEGQEHTVRLVVQTTNTTDGSVDEAITDETLTLTAISDDEFTITLDGETLSFIGESATRDSDGTKLRGRIVQLDGDEYFQMIRLETPEFDGRENELLIGHLVTGFETSPDAAVLTTAPAMGTESYIGGIAGVMNTEEASEFFGTILLNADFGNSLINGNLEMGAVNTDLGLAELYFDVLPADITGNGFVGELVMTGCDFPTCSAEAEISGVFFGPNAEAIAGLLTIDLTVSDGMDTVQNSGNGAIGLELQ